MHAGHYAGTTSQGKAIGFDVAADLASLTNLDFVVDLQCQEAPIVLHDLDVPVGGPYSIAADKTFTVSVSGSTSSGSLSINVHGAFDPEGKASGTLQVDFTVNTSAGTVHCSTGSAT